MDLYYKNKNEEIFSYDGTEFCGKYDCNKCPIVLEGHKNEDEDCAEWVKKNSCLAANLMNYTVVDKFGNPIPEPNVVNNEKIKKSFTLKTPEMWNLAQKNNKYYVTKGLNGEKIFYHKDRGLFDVNGRPVNFTYWSNLDTLMTENWSVCDNIMTKRQAEEKYGIMIVDI